MPDDSNKWQSLADVTSLRKWFPWIVPFTTYVCRVYSGLVRTYWPAGWLLTIVRSTKWQQTFCHHTCLYWYTQMQKWIHQILDCYRFVWRFQCQTSILSVNRNVNKWRHTVITATAVLILLPFAKKIQSTLTLSISFCGKRCKFFWQFVLYVGTMWFVLSVLKLIVEDSKHNFESLPFIAQLWDAEVNKESNEVR